MARSFAPHAAVAASRYLIVPCEAEGCGNPERASDALDRFAVLAMTS